jgi:predicted patatin/cPLA2 family phospholipase
MAKPFLRHVLARYPEVVEAIINRYQAHAAAYELMMNPPAGVDIRVIDPPADFPVKKFSRSRANVLEGFEIGFQTGLESWRGA